jgi:sterol desaturase/sphingolipid hydroxylase (fatty acid hydroxylase superfamily)
METLARAFADLHDRVFEGVVLPVLYQTGFGGYAELAFDATEFFLVGAIEIALLAIVLGALERWFPFERQPGGPDKSVDVLYAVLNRLGLLPLLMFFLLTPLVSEFDSWLRLHDFIPPKVEDVFPALNDSPFATFLIYLVLLDFVGYWLHRWQHRFDAWWALHALHHSQRQMSFWSDDRNHLLDMLVLDAAFSLVALAVGVPPGQFVVIVVATRVAQSLQHANLRLSFGRVGERLLVSPRFHRVHHAIGLGHEGDQRGCNFAVLFPVWDVLFGTANLRDEAGATGIRDQLDGVSYGERFWAQQWLGLKRLARSLRLQG